VVIDYYWNMPGDTADNVVDREIFVEDLVCRAYTEEEIFKAVVEKFPKQQWQRANVRKYILRAEVRIERRCQNPFSGPATRARIVARMKQFEKAKAWAQVAKMEELLARVDGAIAPTRQEIHVHSSMTPELGGLVRGYVGRVGEAVDQALKELLADEDLRMRILARASELIAAQPKIPEQATAKALPAALPDLPDDHENGDGGEDDAGEPAAP
jgi:hypothetical protein